MTQKEGLAGSAIERLEQIMVTLRGDSGCPWDKEQTHQSLRRYLIEECYEVIEAIDDGDMNNLQEELGDLLLQVVFHARLAEESGNFNLNDVVCGISTKMVRRHPHVFNHVKVKNSNEVLVNWEEIKEKEKKQQRRHAQGALHGVPRQLPALIRAYKIQERAARVGFDWPSIDGAWEKVTEETNELKAAVENGDYSSMQEELGDLLFAVVNIARFLKIEPELALAATTAKFEKRFHQMEQQVDGEKCKLQDLTLKEMDYLWEQAKNQEKTT